MAQAALDNLYAQGLTRPKAADGTPTPIPNMADTGYFSKEAVEELEKMASTRTSPHRQYAKAPVPPAAAAPLAEAAAPSAEASAKEKMQSKLRTATGKALYAAQAHRRAGIGMIKSREGSASFCCEAWRKCWPSGN